MSYVKFGFSEFTTWPWTFEKDLAMYKKHGASVIEVCEFKFAHEEFDKLAFVEQAGLTVASVQARVHSIFPDTMAPEPKDPADRVEAIKKAIESSARYLPQGTPFIVITGAEPNRNMRAAIDRTREALKELGEFAAQHGMAIAFEPLNPITVHTDTMLWGLDRGFELVDSVEHPHVGICIDTWNIWETPNVLGVIADCGK
ncbi:MAG TPA: TIM barrel protein, partial [Candidatus Rubrimentiphilum sp.]|nr:TIM barrel protein [Candidatus Rubrimentiphilum sp.]